MNANQIMRAVVLAGGLAMLGGCVTSTTGTGASGLGGAGTENDPSGSGSGSGSGAGASGSTGGTFFYTFVFNLTAVDLATKQETTIKFGEYSLETIGVGGGFITDVEKSEVLTQNAWVNLRKFENKKFSIVDTIDLQDINYDDVVGPARPSADASMFIMATHTPINSDLPDSDTYYVTAFNKAGKTVGRLANYYGPSWLTEDTVVFAGDDGIFTAKVGPTGISKPQRLGKVGLGAPDSAPGQPSVSADGSSITFVQGSMVWKMAADGSDLVQVTEQQDGQYFPIFSPDGSAIVLQWGSCRTLNSGKQAVVPANPTAGPANPVYATKMTSLKPNLQSAVEIGACGPHFWAP